MPLCGGMENLMKRFLLILLALVFALGALVSCNKSGEGTPTNTQEPAAGETDPVPSDSQGDPAPDEPISDKSAEEIIAELDPSAKTIWPTPNSKEAVLKGASKDTVLRAFTDEDFSKVDVTPVDGAKFETVVLRRNFDTVTLYCLAGEVRVMWERLPKNALDMLSPTSETGTGSVVVAQIGTERVSETDNPLNGMCYVIKLSNGRAIIIDGGFNNDSCADNILAALEKMQIQRSGGKYVVEAWIITHGHSDHIGGYQKFASKYSGKITLKNFMSAFPSSESLVVGASKTAEGLSGSRNINPHAGIKYYFGNAAISMLYTPDLLYSADSAIQYFNDSSLVFKLEAGGSEVLFFGDAGEAVAERMLEVYGSAAFKSDIFQLTHHGLYTAANAGHKWTELKKVYDAIEADYAFLPMHSRYGTSGRNGRYTVMIEWGSSNFQVSYVVNEKDNHGLSYVSQQYYDEFVASVANGTNTNATLYGYDGVNKVVNETGLITYLGGNENSPMATVFELSGGEAALILNTPFYDWDGGFPSSR